MNASMLLAFLGALSSLVLAIVSIFRKTVTVAGWLFFLGMLALAFESCFNGLSFAAISYEKMVLWQERATVARSFLVILWLSCSLAYSRGNFREFFFRWRWVITGFCLFSLVLSLGLSKYLFREPQETSAVKSLSFGVAGVFLNITSLFAMVLSLMNLEKTFRTAVGTMRWRIKFVVLGLSVIFGAKIYVGSQSLLYSGLNLSLSTVEAVALLIGCVLIALSFSRSRVLEIDVYPSHTFLFSSITVMLTGIYLLIVGVLARIVVALGDPGSLPLNAFLVLLGVVGLGVLLLSDRFRQHVRAFVSRHFRRPLYDYRKIWNLVTEKTSHTGNEAELSTAAARLIADTFNVLSVTFWLVDENENRLAFTASTALPPEQAQVHYDPTLDLGSMVRGLQDKPRPFNLDESKVAWCEALKKCNPGTFRKGGNRICVPIVASDRVLGIIIIADRVSGLPFPLEELDLLRCIGNHIAASLLSIQLSKKLMLTKEQEAFQAVSAFFAHDLKNAASTLSLMLQNLPTHFENPAFREDVLRGISKTVNHMNHLINRLSIFRQNPELKPVAADLNDVVNGALDQWEALPDIHLITDLQPLPKMVLDSDEIQKVITNLILNARDALAQGGRIHVQTKPQNGWAVLTISDNGCGMTPQFLRQSLFRPFQTTKKDGTGIGMFQCKMIVEAHRGKIEVKSELGKGTAFRILLPLAKT
jgi:putative PEP-CTERM system histidine kinase